MTGHRRFGLALLAVVAMNVSACQSCAESNLNEVTIGYPGSRVLIAGQIGTVLQRTDILAQNGLKGVFAAGKDLPEFAIASAGGMDLLLTGEADPLNRIDHGFEGKIVATLGVGGMMGIVPNPGKTIENWDSLRGGRISLTEGNALHRWTVNTLAKHGLTEKDYETQPYFGWESVDDLRVDATVLWDPMLLIVRQRFERKPMEKGPYYLSVLMSDDFMENRREDALASLVALRQAAWFMAQNKEKVNTWWTEPTNGKPPHRVTHKSAKVNTLYRAKSFQELDLSPNQEEFKAALQEDINFMVPRGFLISDPGLEDVIDGALEAEAARTAFPLETVLEQAL